MIVCTICQAENDDFSVVCSSCKGFLQGRVDTLDLFKTIWQLMENPRAAFKRIVLSKQKNYLLLLSSLFGMSIVFSAIWYMKSGNTFTNLLTLVGTGLLVGPVVGMLGVFILGLVTALTMKLMGRKTTPRIMSAVIAYACVPIVLSLALVFPVEIAIFGQDFFGSNPPPMIIKPAAYVALLGLDSLAVAWSLLLLVKGVSVAGGMAILKSVLAIAPALCVVGCGVVWLSLVKM